jgi:hypothetical protein
MSLRVTSDLMSLYSVTSDLNPGFFCYCLYCDHCGIGCRSRCSILRKSVGVDQEFCDIGPSQLRNKYHLQKLHNFHFNFSNKFSGFKEMSTSALNQLETLHDQHTLT